MKIGRGDRIRTYDLYVPNDGRRGQIRGAFADASLTSHVHFATSPGRDSEGPRRQRRPSSLFPQGEQPPHDDPFPGPPAPPPTQADRDLMTAYSTSAWLVLAVIVVALSLAVWGGCK